MPRVLDFTKGNESDWNEVRLPAPVYGTHEITGEEMDVLARAHNDLVSGFSPQFSTYGMVEQAEKARVMDAAHAWLSEHATGPWQWTEHWTNHGHHIDVAVFIERHTDQRAFAEAHSAVFKYRPDEEYALLQTAGTRGVLPRLTAKESFSVWTRENVGYDFLPTDGLDEEACRVVFTHPALEAKFVERWGAEFRRETEDGHVYLGSLKGRSWRDSPAIWLDANGAIGSMSGGNSPEGYLWKVAVRFDDTAEALLRDWGHVFEARGDGSEFVTKDYPGLPNRQIPADYLAYLRGEAEAYEAPHLHESIRAFQEANQPAAPGPR